MNVSESGLAELYRNLKVTERQVALSVLAAYPRPVTTQRQPVSGPVSAVFTLHGHCPSKKNLWRRGPAGKMYLEPAVKDEINALITQAMFAWKYPGPVEHPEITVRFFVAAERQDQDGMYTTVLDCLQSAGVLVNDNIAHNNGRKVLEPCQFVEPHEERVEITVKRITIAVDGSAA